MLFAGIDAGSRTIKLMIIDEKRAVRAQGVFDQGIRQKELAFSLFLRILEENHLKKEDIQYMVATGYGRDSLDFADTAVTEITCHAKGVSFLHPDVKTIVDIGGQDSKLIRLENGGLVRDFVMNDRCAAGTGRFLEVVAKRLEIPVSQIGLLAEGADQPCVISSMCVVFAETEIVGLLAAGESAENIAAGVQNAIALRIAGMAGRSSENPVIFTGGVALIRGMDAALSRAMRQSVSVSNHPQLTGALGAALLAKQRSGF